MAEKPTLLIVDDDAVITEALAFALGKDFQILASDSRRHAVSLLRQLAEPPQLALVDLGLPPSPQRPDEGFALISALLAHAPATKILVFAGQDEADARHALALGATEIAAKPCDPEKLKRTLMSVLQFRSAEVSGEGLGDADLLLGSSPAVHKLKSQISQYADSPFPVLIEGEPGTGKALVARLLHRLSCRRRKPWFAFNCAAVAPTLVEPTLFGYARGSFTGAGLSKAGYFEDAADGTVYLDDIGELSTDLQAKLQRLLETGEYQRVGETQPRPARARVIAATQRDLRQEMRKGRFRADLYHRLSMFTIAAPPLREMEEDKTRLLEHYRKFYAGQAKLQPFSFDESALRLWNDYQFPGNVRELRNITIRLMTRYAGQRISAQQLERELDTASDTEGPRPTAERSIEALIEQASRHLQRERAFNLDHMLKAWEQGYIDAAMKLTRGNVSQAAKMLGINRTTLYSRMESLHKQQ